MEYLEYNDKWFYKWSIINVMQSNVGTFTSQSQSGISVFEKQTILFLCTSEDRRLGHSHSHCVARNESADNGYLTLDPSISSILHQYIHSRSRRIIVVKVKWLNIDTGFSNITSIIKASINIGKILWWRKFEGNMMSCVAFHRVFLIVGLYNEKKNGHTI